LSNSVIGPLIGSGVGASAGPPARMQDGGGLRLAALQQLLQRGLLAALQALQQSQVGAGEQAQVVGVLAVDALEALGDHQPHARRQLGQRRMLARAALAVAAAAHQHADAGAPQRVEADGALTAGGEAGVRVAPQRGVEIHHRRQRRDLVGGDVVAQGAGFGARDVAAGQLRTHQRRVAAQEQAPAEAGQFQRHCASTPAFFTSCAYLASSLRKNGRALSAGATLITLP
jgi:hypothetical protein